jgi:LmbE family N-acetylglucosaminyl deacetylase
MLTDYQPKRLLAVVAHPDDLEATLGGTVIKWSQNGSEVHLLVCTDGSNGSTDLSEVGKSLAETRKNEQHEAATVLGLASVTHLPYQDGQIELTKDLTRDIVRQIRILQPDAVFTLDPTFVYSSRWNYPNHRDHRVVGQATFDAVYPLARDMGSFRELLDDDLQPHTVANLLLWNFDTVDTMVDVSETYEQKKLALRQHRSQFGDDDSGFSLFEEVCRDFGSRCGCELAEGFVKLDLA